MQAIFVSHFLFYDKNMRAGQRLGKQYAKGAFLWDIRPVHLGGGAKAHIHEYAKLPKNQE